MRGPEPELLASARAALSNPDAGRRSMALFDAVDAALLRAWDEAKGRPPDARFGAALRAARGISAPQEA